MSLWERQKVKNDAEKVLDFGLARTTIPTIILSGLVFSRPSESKLGHNDEQTLLEQALIPTDERLLSEEKEKPTSATRPRDDFFDPPVDSVLNRANVAAASVF